MISQENERDECSYGCHCNVSERLLTAASRVLSFYIGHFFKIRGILQDHFYHVLTARAIYMRRAADIDIAMDPKLASYSTALALPSAVHAAEMRYATLIYPGLVLLVSPGPARGVACKPTCKGVLLY